MGLASLGVVSLASAVNAAEPTSETVALSGYVDTSAQWNPGTGNANLPPYSFGGPSKADGFNLNVVQLSLEKALDESEWAAGYRVDLWAGPDANRLGTQSVFGFSDGETDSASAGDFAIRQAYVNLRTPVGNGLEWKIGVFDTVIGYESVASPNNPNYTRSYGQTIEPQTHTGILASYRVNDVLSLAAGVANTVGPRINSKAHGPNLSDSTKSESSKTYMASIAITAPESLGFLAGSTLYGGIVSGFNEGASNDVDPTGENTTSYYVGTTLATPVAGLKFGAAWDYLDVHNLDFGTEDGVAWSAALYASFQATEKLSLHWRGEFLDDQAGVFYDATGPLSGTGYRVWANTATLQYDLWKNVLSRLEVRWDHSDSGARLFGGTVEGDGTRRNALMVAANVIYKF
jgi:hypothetical protein